MINVDEKVFKEVLEMQKERDIVPSDLNYSVKFALMKSQEAQDEKIKKLKNKLDELYEKKCKELNLNPEDWYSSEVLSGLDIENFKLEEIDKIFAKVDKDGGEE